MNKFIIGFLIATSLLFADETIPTFPSPEKDLAFPEEEIQTKFLYLAAGLNAVMPTASLGYRMIYGAMGSDISVSGILIPGFGWSSHAIGGVFPSLQYKQLFFMSHGIHEGKSAYYMGPKTGIYPFILLDKRFYIDFGAVAGKQIKREKGYDFFEFGLSPFLISLEGRYGRIDRTDFSLVPSVSLTYGLMF